MKRILCTPHVLKALLLLLIAGIQCTVFGQARVASVKINKSVAFQKITGFGAFVNSPQFGYNHMTPAEIQQVWGAGSQAGCNIMRIFIPTGESNWAQTIPTAQQAKSLGLKIFASPWSMPTEWKTVNIIGSQYDSSGIKKEVYLKPEHYGDYARYLNNFVLLLRANGVELDAISLQNEPDYKVDYAGCVWTTSQMTKFLREFSDSITCPVLAPETVGMPDNYANALGASDVLPKFKIFGGHQYGGIGTAIKNLQAKGKELWMTEFLVNWNSDENTSRNFDWTKDAFSFAGKVNEALLANVNAWIHYAAKRFYGLMGDGQFGTTTGVLTKRGRIFSQFAKYLTGSTRVQHTFNDNSGVLNGSAYLSATGDSVYVVVLNPSASTYSLSVDLPFLSVSGKTVRTTATEDLTATDLTFAETTRPAVVLSPSSVTTLVFKKSGDFTPSQMVSQVVNFKKIETQAPTSAAFGTAYQLSGKTAVFSANSRLISTNTTAANGYLALDGVYNRLVFSVDTLTSAGSYTSSVTTLNYINAAGAVKSYNYGSIAFNQRTNFNWVLDISPNVLTDTCKGIISLTTTNAVSILTFKLKNVFLALGTEKELNLSGPYSPYDGNLLDGFADTAYTSYNFTGVTGIPAATNWYGAAVNKNAVFYTAAGTLSNGINVVSGTASTQLQLNDQGGDFYPPAGFTAIDARYQGTLNGYKMLTLPFAARIPAGVKAYTLVFAEGQVKGTRITGDTLPAHMPVLVYGSGSFSFSGAGNIVPQLNPRTDIATGVYIRVKVPVNSYALTLTNGVPSFTRATAAVQPSVYSFDAYLSPAATASSLKVVLNDTSTAAPPMLTVSAASPANLAAVSGTGYATVGSFTLSGSDLPQNVALAAPAPFEISLRADSGYAASLSLVPSGGTLASTTIYARLVSGQAVATYTGAIAITSAGAESRSVALSGTVYAQAVVTASETTITGLGYNTFSTAMAPVKSFQAGGSPLAGDVTITAPAHFEVSRTANSGYVPSLTLGMANGTVAATTLYVRLKGGLAANTYSGNIVVTSATAADKLVALNGAVIARRAYDFTQDAAATAATTPPATDITVASGNNATAGVISYTDAAGNTGNRFRAYSGGNRNATGIVDLNLFPSDAADYSVTWKQSIGSVTDYKVGCLLRGGGPAGTATTGYVQGMLNGYVFIVYNAGAARTEFRIYRSTAATSLNTLVNTTVAGYVPAVGQSVWYRASATGASPVSLKLEYSVDSITWNNGAVATDASADPFTTGATQLVWGLGSPGYNFYMDDITYKKVPKAQAVTFKVLAPKRVGDAAITLEATASSGLPVRYSSSDTGVATVVDGTLHLVGQGTATITALQSGNEDYAPAQATQTLAVLPWKLLVQHLDGDGGQTANNNLRPYLKVVSQDSVPVLLGELTARYWMTTENASSIIANIDWAKMGAAKVKARYVGLAAPLQGATGYVEYSFDTAAGLLKAGANSGEIFSKVYHSNWKALNELNDYSYAAHSTFTVHPKVTLYRNGQLIWGVEPADVGGASVVKSAPGEEQAQASGVSVYPNPVSDHLVIRSGSLLAGATVQVIDARGATVVAARLTTALQTLPVRQLAPGLYHVVVRNGLEVTTASIVKQ
ncbi:cellulose binding domain-containing protein [Paraflavisolibacter sp. H34]|uniref:cellulose binding domain-containing protein n=1 Tax=Huijunlia imazamoxiresistens TaxID=3127457 RepID=UPI003015EE15